MSDDTTPIAHDSALGKLLDKDTVPPLSDDFADRVLARSKDRAPPLPQPRSKGGGSRWRSARRLGIGAVAAGALASAAAAMGLLDNLPIDLPSPAQVWGTITGQPAEDNSTEPASAIPPAEINPAATPGAGASIEIEGPIDTPEELEEAFRRIDRVRGERRETRRSNVDRQIDRTLDRRREKGLRVPTPEQEQRFRDGIERFRERSDARSEERTERRREGLRERIENGESLNREDFAPGNRPWAMNPRVREELDRLRELSPAERRQRMRELRDQRRERRQQRLQQQPALEPLETPVDEPENGGE